MRIFLLGFMGSGKSTIGRSLSISLKYTHIDLDRYVEQQVGATIPEIFAVPGGEDAFRAYEAKYLRQCVASMDDVVVSTGGGTPCFNDNMEFMRQSGLTIYLQSDPDCLAERLLKSQTPRPLLAGKNEVELRRFIADALAVREPYYNRSALILANSTRDVSRLLELIKYEQQRKTIK